MPLALSAQIAPNFADNAKGGSTTLRVSGAGAVLLLKAEAGYGLSIKKWTRLPGLGMMTKLLKVATGEGGAPPGSGITQLATGSLGLEGTQHNAIGVARLGAEADKHHC